MTTQPQSVHFLRLREVLPWAQMIDGQMAGSADIQLSGCSSDSRTCRAGDVFVAIAGHECDGHDFAPEAVLRGAAAIVCERPLPDIDAPQYLVPDSREALGHLCQALAGDPSEQLKVIGVTGTNGKTTTSMLIASVLGMGGHPTGLMGTLGSSDGMNLKVASHTTPPAPVVADWLARTAANGCTHAVLEVSSHALDQSRLAGVTLDVACVTNVRHDHLDYHGSPGDYLAAKGRIFELLRPEGVAVINADDPGASEYLDMLAHPTLTVNLHEGGEITGTIIEQTATDQTFLLTAGEETMPVRTALIGTHNVHNCLIAAAVGFANGLDLATIVRGLEGVDFVPGRLQQIECGQAFRTYVDYAHTPDALEVVLDTLREVTPGRVICVFGAGGDRDKFKRPLMGRAAARRADVVVVTSDNPRTEDPEAIMEEILTGCHGAGKGGSGVMVRAITDRADAIRWALRNAGEGDCVLIAGKGHEDYQIVGHARYHFDDGEFARECLYEEGCTTQALRLSAA